MIIAETWYEIEQRRIEKHAPCILCGASKRLGIHFDKQGKLQMIHAWYKDIIPGIHLVCGGNEYYPENSECERIRHQACGICFFGRECFHGSESKCILVRKAGITSKSELGCNPKLHVPQFFISIFDDMIPEGWEIFEEAF